MGGLGGLNGWKNRVEKELYRTYLYRGRIRRRRLISLVCFRPFFSFSVASVAPPPSRERSRREPLSRETDLESLTHQAELLATTSSSPIGILKCQSPPSCGLSMVIKTADTVYYCAHAYDGYSLYASPERYLYV